MEDILTIDGMKDSTAVKILNYNNEGLDIEEISRKTRVGVEKIKRVIEINSIDPEASHLIGADIDMEETELTPDNIITEGIDSEAEEIITMQPKTPTASKAKEKKNPKLDSKIISMSSLPGKGRKR